MPSPSGATFEGLLGGLARAGLVRLSPDTFEKDGRTITFQRAALTPEGRSAGPAEIAAVPLEETAPAAAASPQARAPEARDRGVGPRPRAMPATRKPAPRALPPSVVAKLRAWRLAEARRRGVPAFRIFPDRTLFALAEARPASEDALMAVTGVGPRLARLYGSALLKLLARPPASA